MFNDMGDNETTKIIIAFVIGYICGDKKMLENAKNKISGWLK